MERDVRGSEDKVNPGTRPPLDDALIAAVVDRFYAAARSDPLLGPIFKRVISDAAWRSHLDLISDFWSSLLLGTHRYAGRPMPKHLAIGDLEDEHFVRWLALFRETVEALCEPAVAVLFVDRAERIAQSFRLGIAFHRGEDTTSIEPLRAQLPDGAPT
jgi:hemoglobin